MVQAVKEVKDRSLTVSGTNAPSVRDKGYTKGAGSPILGKTLPSLLYNALAQFNNTRMFNRRQGDGWETISLEDFRDQAENIALGLYDLGLVKGDRVSIDGREIILQHDIPAKHKLALEMLQAGFR